VASDEPPSNTALIRIAFDLLLSLVVGTVGLIVYDVRQDIKDMQAHAAIQDAAIALVRERMPIEYVRMDVYIRDRVEIRESLARIEALHREAVLNHRR
jgi:hypothetical protein